MIVRFIRLYVVVVKGKKPQPAALYFGLLLAPVIIVSIVALFVESDRSCDYIVGEGEDQFHVIRCKLNMPFAIVIVIIHIVYYLVAVVRNLSYFLEKKIPFQNTHLPAAGFRIYFEEHQEELHRVQGTEISDHCGLHRPRDPYWPFTRRNRPIRCREVRLEHGGKWELSAKQITKQGNRFDRTFSFVVCCIGHLCSKHCRGEDQL